MIVAGAVLLLGLIGGASTADTQAAIAGTWEGESKCMLPGSPCHDEHVIYEVKADPKAADHFTIDAYKIVAGARDFMGALDCRYPYSPGVLRCIGRRPEDVWLFDVMEHEMTGTLTIGTEKQLFRKVHVSRQTGH